MAETMQTILATSREVYEKTMCGAAGCCGDFNGALEYIDGAVGEAIQETVNIAVAAALELKLTIVGLNPLGDVVLFCDRCKDTFAKKVQGMTMEELTNLKNRHKCEATQGGRA